MRCTLLLGLVVVVAVGCSSDDAPKLDPLSQEEQAALPSVDSDGLKALLASHKGKAAVLAVWSAGHKDCEGLLPALAGVEKGAAVITLSIDRVDDVREKVLPIVTEHGGAFENRVFGGAPPDIETFLKPEWSWRVPAIVLYGRGGSKVAEFYGREAVARAKAKLR